MASAQPAGRPGPHQPGRSADPASTTARCNGWFGSAAFSAARVAGIRPVVDRRTAAARARCVRGRNTDPIRTPAGPGCRGKGCAARCPAVPGAAWCASAGGRRPADCASATARRRTSSAASPSASSSPVPMNGKDSTSVSPAEARSAAMSRFPALPVRSARCPAGACGRIDGMVSIALQPGHLLDQVGRAGQVGPPGGRRNCEKAFDAGIRPRRRSRPAAAASGDDGRLVRPAGQPLRLVQRQARCRCCGNGFPATSERPTMVPPP